MVVRETLVALLEGIPAPLAVMLLAMIPIVELRGALPLGYFYYGMPVWEAALWSVIGNLLPIPILLLFLGPVERFLRRWTFWDRFFTKVFDRTVRKLDEHVKRYEAIALVLFVGIPLPVTGGWTASAAAHVFSLGFWRSLVCIALGILLAALIVGTLVASGRALWLFGGA